MKILLADDHPLVRVGIKLLLTRLNRQAEILEAQDYPEALKICAEQQNLELILLDRTMPGMNGSEGFQRLRQQAPDVPIVILSASEESVHVWEALDGGARGYIPKSSSQEVLHTALQLVLSGGTYLPPTLLNGAHSRSTAHHSSPHARATRSVSELTPRQREVLQLLVRGKSNKHIANTLNITEATVCTHVNAIFKVLQVSNRTEAAHIAAARGWIS